MQCPIIGGENIMTFSSIWHGRNSKPQRSSAFHKNNSENLNGISISGCKGRLHKYRQKRIIKTTTQKQD